MEYLFHFFHLLFYVHVCYQTGRTRSEWGKGVIKHIPEPGMTDPRQPLNYIGINLASPMYKLFFSVLNERFTNA